MVHTAMAMMLLMAAPDAMKQSRENFGRCLKDVVRTSIEKKIDLAAFSTSLGEACKDKEQALRATLLAADAAMGLKRAASEKATDEQIADYRMMAKEDFEVGIKDQ